MGHFWHILVYVVSLYRYWVLDLCWWRVRFNSSAIALLFDFPLISWIVVLTFVSPNSFSNFHVFQGSLLHCSSELDCMSVLKYIWFVLLVEYFVSDSCILSWSSFMIVGQCSFSSVRLRNSAVIRFGCDSLHFVFLYGVCFSAVLRNGLVLHQSFCSSYFLYNKHFFAFFLLLAT